MPVQHAPIVEGYTQKRNKRIFRKTLKWAALALGGYAVVTTILFGQSDIDEKSGMYTYHWSGVDALFSNKEDFGFFTNTEVPTSLDGFDGPYLFGSQQFTVDANNKLIKTTLIPGAPVKVTVANQEKDSFFVPLRSAYPREAETYALPARLIAISDIEGNFDGFSSFLIHNGVMDKQYNWTFGQGHLVLNGDFVDRGENETQVLWLIYMLEAKAAAQGGKVHFILGNHELMKMQGNNSYATYKYREVAKQISGESRWDVSTQYLYSSSSETGKWLRSKNIVEKIGDYLFVHAGLKAKLIEENLTLPELNRIARKYYGASSPQETSNAKEALVLSSYDSPYWDRSLSLNLLYRTYFLFMDPLNANFHKTTQQELEQTLQFYGASKMVIGHSVVKDITADYEGKVLKIDVKHGQRKNTGQTKGLLIENNVEYKIDDLGNKTKLQSL